MGFERGDDDVTRGIFINSFMPTTIIVCLS